MFVFFGKARALAHPKAVLFVGHNHSRRGKSHAVRKQCLRADDNGEAFLRVRGGQGRFDFFLFGGWGGADQQRYPDPQRGEERLKIGRVLTRQDLGRRHKSGLSPVSDRQIKSGRSADGFAASHISHHHPAHGDVFFHIGANLSDYPSLCTGQREGELGKKGRKVIIGAGRRASFPRFSRRERKSQRKEKELVKNKTLFGGREREKTVRIVNVAQSPCPGDQFFTQTDLFRERIFPERRGRKRRADIFFYQFLCQRTRKAVDRQQFGERGVFIVGLIGRAVQQKTPPALLHFPVKAENKAGQEDFFQIFLIEIGDLAHAAFVKSLEFEDRHPPAYPRAFYFGADRKKQAATRVGRRFGKQTDVSAVLIGAGKMKNQVVKRADAEFFIGRGLGRTYTVQFTDRRFLAFFHLLRPLSFPYYNRGKAELSRKGERKSTLSLDRKEELRYNIINYSAVLRRIKK